MDFTRSDQDDWVRFEKVNRWIASGSSPSDACREVHKSVKWWKMMLVKFHEQVPDIEAPAPDGRRLPLRAVPGVGLPD